MSLPLILTSEAEADLAEAKAWYASRQKGLDIRFVQSIEQGLDTIRQFPRIGKEMNRDVRRLVLRHFPYAIFYRVSEQHIAVLAVYHSRRDPRGWRIRF
ncbi:MAG: type II toxin-antitoxin system RelE/ParE family toxin [Gemmataceae bacterium]